MAQVLAGNTNANTGDCPNGPPPLTPPVPPGLIDCYSEFLPTPAYAGPMHFRLTARDGRAGGGGVASAETIVSLAPGTGPFRVTAPSTPRPRGSGTTQTVTWDVAGTAGGAIDAANVRISLSTDGGHTFPVTLAESTANDGSAQVMPPAATSNQARIKIEALGNVFFDVSDANFSMCSGSVASTGGPTAGDDVIVGTEAADTIDSLAGNDRICSLAGSDSLTGNTGNDQIKAGSGADAAFGGGRHDRVSGGRADDDVRGQGGDDVLEGNKGNDDLTGAAGSDQLSGNDGEDHLVGGPGHDVCDGGPGADSAEQCEVLIASP